MSIWSPEHPNLREEFVGYVGPEQREKYLHNFRAALRLFNESLETNRNLAVVGEQLGKALIGVMTLDAEEQLSMTGGIRREKSTSTSLAACLDQMKNALEGSYYNAILTGAVSEYATMHHFVEMDENYPVYLPDSSVDNYEEGKDKIDCFINFNTEDPDNAVIGAIQIKTLPFLKPIERHVYDLSSLRDRDLIENIYQSNLLNSLGKYNMIEKWEMLKNALTTYAASYENVAPLLLLYSSPNTDRMRGLLPEYADKNIEDYTDIILSQARLGAQTATKISREIMQRQGLYLTKMEQFGTVHPAL